MLRIRTAAKAPVPGSLQTSCRKLWHPCWPEAHGLLLVLWGRAHTTRPCECAPLWLLLCACRQSKQRQTMYWCTAAAG